MSDVNELEPRWRGSKVSRDLSISVLLGKIITGIIGLEVGSDRVTIQCSDGARYSMHHDQDCCESVDIEDISGDPEDLIGSPITLAEESTSSEANPEGVVKEHQDSFTWTFYRIGTAKGVVVLRWYGESNGYYSESVDFVRLLNQEPQA